MTTPAAATDRCPRCGGGFDCGASRPGPCACTTVTLPAALQRRLRDGYSGCLCLRCLHELAAAGADAAAGGPVPPPPGGGSARSG